MYFAEAMLTVGDLTTSSVFVPVAPVKMGPRVPFRALTSASIRAHVNPDTQAAHAQ